MTTAGLPQHHLPEDFLLEYSLGHLPRPLRLVADLHLKYCNECTAYLLDLEQQAGEALMSLPPADWSGSIPVPGDEGDAFSETTTSDLDQVESLLRGARNKDWTGWKKFLHIVRYADLKLGDSSFFTRVIKLQPGATVPHHGHSGTECTFVFAGGLEVDEASLEPGDIWIVDANNEHALQADSHDGCLALVVQEGKLKPKTIRGKLLSFFSKDF